MAIRGNSITVTYVAWDTVNNVGKTGDAANHTVKVVKDGTAATATNVPAEVDATNAKGVYKLTLTATEMTCDCVTVCGASATAGVVIIPVTVTTEHGVLPNVQQGSVGAVVTSGTGAGQIALSAGAVGSIAAGGITNASLAANTGLATVRSGAAQAGGATSVTLDSGASATADFYKGCLCFLTGGTGAGQARLVVAYSGTTKAATVDWAWAVNPDATTTFVLLPTGEPTLNASLQVTTTAADPWGTNLPGAYAAGTAGSILGTNLDAAVSSRSTYAGADTPGTTTLVGRLTATRATNLDNLDATVSSRSTYAGADTPGTTTLVGRLTATRATNLDNLDAAVSTRLASSAYAAPPAVGQVATAVWTDLLTGADFGTAGSIGSLLKTDVDAAVSSRSTYAGGDTPGTTTLVGRLTSTRATNLDNLDATVSSRLASSTYAAPPTVSQVATAVWTDLLAGADFGTAVSIGSLLKANLDATVSSRSTYAGADTPGTTTLVGRLTATRAGNLDNLDATISSRSTYAGGDTPGITTLVGRLTATRATNLDNLDATVSSRSTLAAAGVWDLNTAGHTTSGTFGAAMNAAGSAGDPWGTNLPGAYAAGTAGSILGTNLNATVSSRMATFALPANFSALAVDVSGRVTVGTNNDKTGYSLTQAFPANFPALAVDVSGRVDVGKLLGVASAGAAGYVGVDWSHVANPASALDLAGTTVKTLDQAPPDEAGVTTVLGRLTAARAGYLDNLNVGGAVASHADVLAVNQSASKHLLLATVSQFEPGETYTVEMRTFQAADGSAVDADVTPTLTAAGQVSGDLSANLSAPSHPAAGVYRWTYTPGAGPTLEQIRFDGSATVAGSSFSLSAYSQTVSASGSSWTSTDQSHLTAVYNKLPAGNVADQALLAAAVGSPQQAGVAVTLPAGTPAGFLTAASYGTAPGWYSAPDNADVVATLSDVVTLLGRVSGPVALGSDMQTALDRLGTLLARLTSPVPFDAGGFVESAPQYLPAIPAGWVTAAGIAAGALDGKGDWLTALSGGDTPGVVTLLTRVPGVVQPQTGDAYAAATAATALVVGVKARTDNLPADPAGMSGLAAAHGVGSWVGGGGGGGAGTGSTPVDHNYGGTDNLAYLVPGGVRVADARVDVYLTSDWSANRRGPFYVVASSLTGADGRWVRPVMLDPGTYTVVFYKPGEYGPDTASVVVS